MTGSPWYEREKQHRATLRRMLRRQWLHRNRGYMTLALLLATVTLVLGIGVW